jgi:aminotransferase
MRTKERGGGVYVPFKTGVLPDMTRAFDLVKAAGFRPRLPEGAYYILCDISGFGFADDVAFARWLVREVGVAAVPGSSFFSRPELGRGLIRFTFCKTEDLLREAGERLLRTEERARASR